MNAKPRKTPAAVEEPVSADDTIEQGKRLIRLPDDRGGSLSELVTNYFYRMTWGTPLHAMRLKGKYPLKLLAAPEDPIPGDARAGNAIRAGHFLFRGLRQPLAEIDYTQLEQPDAFLDYIHSFRWLRDLAAAANRGQAIPIAEGQVRTWLAVHGEKPSEPAWRADNAAWRILMWTAYAPFILSTGDQIYRSLVLNSIARTARHLDRGADKAAFGLARVTAWSGIVAAGLLLPGGEPRRTYAEAGLKRAIEGAFYADGGLISRSPLDQLEAINLFSTLRAVYHARGEEPPAFLSESLERIVAALLGILHGDGSPGCWQGAVPVDAGLVAAIVGASGVRTRPLRQARDWGYQRLAAGQTVLLVDAAPPPVARLAGAGCASTAAIELSDGPVRIFQNCGGAGVPGAYIPADLSLGLRTTAAHSALVLDDSNSTAILADGTLGRGVSEVEVDRQEADHGSRLEIAHDGYARRLGFSHRRIVLLSGDGREVRGEDVLTPSGRKRRASETSLALRFHLGPDIEPTLTADRQGALLRSSRGTMWQFRVGAGEIAIEEGLWVDSDGRPHPGQQLVVALSTDAGGASIGWMLKKSA